MELKEININHIELLENIRQKPLKEDLSELMQSIKQEGLLQPIGVKLISKDKYVLVWGFRRLLACKKLGYSTIEARILERDVSEDDFVVLNTTENIQRRNISMIELGRVCWHLKKKLSTSEIASRLGLPLGRIKNALDEFQRVPEKLRNKIKLFATGTMNKAGNLGSTSTSRIIRIRGTSAEERERLLEWARKEEKSSEEIRVVLKLIKSGMSISQAEKEIGNWRAFSTKGLIRKTAYDQIVEVYGGTTQFLRACMKEKVHSEFL